VGNKGKSETAYHKDAKTRRHRGKGKNITQRNGEAKEQREDFFAAE
jgi:hypothetical protein